MWSAIKSVSTIIGLVAVSFGIAFLIAKDFLARNLIETSFEALLLVSFICCFMLCGMVFSLLGIPTLPIFKFSQFAWGSGNKQELDTSKLKKGEKEFKQTALGKRNKQKIK